MVLSQNPKAATNVKDVNKVILQIGKEDSNNVTDDNEETDNDNM